MGFQSILRANWKSGVAWLSWNLLGMLGLWGGGVLVFLFLKNPPWLQLIDRGQFFLYSVGFLAPALYALQKERRITMIPFRGILTFSAVAALLVCALAFAGMLFVTFTDSPDIESRSSLTRYLGIGTLVGSTVIGFLVAVVAEERQDFDYAKMTEARVRSRLDSEIEGIEGGSP